MYIIITIHPFFTLFASSSQPPLSKNPSNLSSVFRMTLLLLSFLHMGGDMLSLSVCAWLILANLISSNLIWVNYTRALHFLTALIWWQALLWFHISAAVSSWKQYFDSWMLTLFLYGLRSQKSQLRFRRNAVFKETRNLSKPPISQTYAEAQSSFWVS